jgi:hypothetical protein
MEEQPNEASRISKIR